MAGCVLRGTGGLYNVSSTSNTAYTHANTQVGDLLVAVLQSNDPNVGTNMPTPAGWTLQYSKGGNQGGIGLGLVIYTRLSPGSGSQGFTWTAGFTIATSIGIISISRPGTVQFGPEFFDSAGYGTTITAPSLTPSDSMVTNGGVLLTVVAGGGAGQFNPPSGMTELQDGGMYRVAETSWQAYSSMSATGGRTATEINGYSMSPRIGINILVSPGNAAPTAPVVTAPNGGETVNNSVNVTWNNGTDPDGDAITHEGQYTRDNGASWNALFSGYAGGPYVWNTSAIAASTACRVRIRTVDSYGATSAWDESNANFTIQHNVAPNAPTLTGPANNATLDRTITQRFSWVFSDPDAGDSQSKFDLQYRIGAGAWTTVTQTTTSNFYDFAPSSLAAGTYEWQVRTYDALGVVGPWSSSSFVTMSTPPATPTITIPASGGSVSTQSDVVAWSVPAQTSYQVRRVADNAGSPDVATVYYDSAEVVSETARNAALSFPVNNRYEHIQVRIKASGLWSTWASVRVQVSYTPPQVAPVVLTADPANGLVMVSITNPAVAPTVTSNEIWRKEIGPFGGGVKRIAVVAPNSTYNDHSAPGNTTLEYYVVAKAANGTSTQSATYTTSLALRGIWLGDPTDWSTLHRFPWDGEGRGVTFEPEVSLNEYIGRKFPVAEFGTSAREAVRLALPLDNETGDREAFQKLIRRVAVLLYRDGRGRKMYCVLQSENMADTTYGGKVDFAAYAVDYDEAV